MNFGNWYRPLSSLAVQTGLGIQFVIGHEQGGSPDGKLVNREDYKAGCRAMGIYYILQAPPDDATLAIEAIDPYCLGWDQKDEPNNPTPVTVPHDVLRANYVKWKTAAPDKLVMLNYDGWQQWSDFDYKAAADSADIFFFDYYVRNRDGKSKSITSTISSLVDRFRSYNPGKKIGFFLETDDQYLGKQEWANTPDANGIFPSTYMCGPTAADLQEYFDVAKSKAVDYVALFSDVIGLWFEGYDGTSAENYAQIRSNILKLSTPLVRNTTVDSLHAKELAAIASSLGDVADHIGKINDMVVAI